jgi:hypothetical protein
MIVLCAFKTELDLNNVQKTACARHAGAARWTYNWGLARKIEAYQKGEKVPTAIDLHRQLNVLKKGELAWMYEVSKCAPQEALRNLDQAYAHFFRRVKEKKAGRKIRAGFPRFKSKKNGLGSFRLTGAIHVFDHAIQLPRLGRLRLKERGYLPVEGVHILSATVSESAGRWFVSVQVEMSQPEPLKTAIEDLLQIPVTFSTLPPRTIGYCRYDPNQDCHPRAITISDAPTLSGAQRLDTLAHEAGHAMLYSGLDYRLHTERSLRELETESVAFCVLSALGFDSSQVSFGYIASWAESGGKDTVKEIERSGQRILEASRRILNWIEENMGVPVELEMAAKEEEMVAA